MTVVDIEDSILETEASPGGKSGRSSGNLLKVTKKGPNGTVDSFKTLGSSFLPGCAIVHLRTWGCSHNSSDSEYMAGLLAAAGYKLTKKCEEADLWVLNSCTVKNPSEQQLQNEIANARSRGIPVVVCGCVSQAAPNTPWLKGLSLVGVQQIDRIVEVVEATIQGNSVRLLSSKKDGKKRLGGASLELPKVRRNPLIEILAINTGCLNHCTYCKTKQARGDLASYPMEELVKRARQSFAEGVKEIWLTSEDLGAYGRDLGLTLPDLLFQLLPLIPEGALMRLGMTNPPYIMDHMEEVAEILGHPRVYSFLHIPVQSGSNGVLADMRREYSIEDFRRLVDFMFERVQGLTIATDIICGFPTETDEDFQETFQLVKDYKFPSLFINQFYPRPGTPAARLKRIDTNKVKRRTKILSDYFKAYRPYEGFEGRVFEVLVTEEATDGCHLVGHTKSYQQVLLPGNPCLLGRTLRCRIFATGKYYMMGKPFALDFWKAWLVHSFSSVSSKDLFVFSAGFCFVLAYVLMRRKIVT